MRGPRQIGIMYGWGGPVVDMDYPQSVAELKEKYRGADLTVYTRDDEKPFVSNEVAIAAQIEGYRISADANRTIVAKYRALLDRIYRLVSKVVANPSDNDMETFVTIMTEIEDLRGGESC